MMIALSVPVGVDTATPEMPIPSSLVHANANGTLAITDENTDGIIVNSVCPEPLHNPFSGKTKATRR